MKQGISDSQTPLTTEQLLLVQPVDLEVCVIRQLLVRVVFVVSSHPGCH